MTSASLTDRTYAYLHITGPGNHETITETLEIQPSSAANVGDINSSNGKPYRLMRWHLDSGLDDTHPLDEHIAMLLTHLGTRPEALRKLWLDYDLTLQCVGYFRPSGHGVHFNREQVRQAASLGLAIDMDFYYVEDHGHDLPWPATPK